MPARAVDLTRHVVIEDRLVPQLAYLSAEHAQQRARHEFAPGKPPPRAADAARGALSHVARHTATVQTADGPREQDADEYREVAHTCGCGASLHEEADQVPGAWGDHVAELTGWDREAVLAHMPASLRSEGEAVVLMCRCGTACAAKGHMPDAAIAVWAEHLRVAAS